MRIWFNHWFSTAYHLIDLMRRGTEEALVIIGSNSNPQAVYRRVCDEWYPDKEMEPLAYVDFCLDFCTAHAVDVFVPRRGLVAIASQAARFEAMGVRLLLEKNAPMVEMLEDKAQTYAYFRSRIPEMIPDYRVTHDLIEFREACEELTSASGRLCYKLCVDEGARSFRVLDENIESAQALYAKPGTKVTRRAAEAILSGYDFSVPLMVMPWLSGADVSVDCLDTDRGRIMLPRFKVGRYTQVRPERKIMDLCSGMMDLMQPKMPVNIQFKMEGETPYLLEINPRMSGGLQLSCKATGINLPALALNKLLDREMYWEYPEPWEPASVVNLETPVIVSKG